MEVLTNRRILGLLVLVLAGMGWVYGGARVWLSLVVAKPYAPPPAATLDKFAILRSYLPARGVLGYRTLTVPSSFQRLMVEEDPHYMQRLYFEALLAQYALAPLRLKWRDDLEWTLGNYLSDRAAPALPEGIGVVEVLRPGDGLVLYRRL